jgi:predicted helicase
MANKHAQIFHFDLYGKREDKYLFLNENSVKTIEWNTLDSNAPNFFFINKNFDDRESYENGFKIDDLFNLLGPGVETGLDRVFISNSKFDLMKTFQNISLKTDEVFKSLNIENKTSYLVKDKLKTENFLNIEKHIVSYQYKVFDFKYIAYYKNSLRRADYNIFKNVNQNNFFLTLMRTSVDSDGFKSILISKSIIDKNLYSFQTYAIPLYLYPETNAQQTLGQTAERTPNLNAEIVNQIAEKLGLTFTNEKEPTENTFAPIDILDYIYAVLHSPTYREKYKEFLKIDFPRVPYPKDKDTFWQLVKLGGEIRQIHLLESPKVEQYITQYPIDGDNVVSMPKYFPIPKNDKTGALQGNVYINDTQYFANVPLQAWRFYIGGYQPAQKWLKDRKNRKLEFEDILHYQKIIVALTETDRLMKEIDKIEIEDI